MAKGDFINIQGASIRREILVETQGRILEDSFEKEGNVQWYVVSERTRAGTVTRKVWFRADDVVSIEKHIKEA